MYCIHHLDWFQCGGLQELLQNTEQELTSAFFILSTINCAGNGRATFFSIGEILLGQSLLQFVDFIGGQGSLASYMSPLILGRASPQTGGFQASFSWVPLSSVFKVFHLQKEKESYRQFQGRGNSLLGFWVSWTFD